MFLYENTNEHTCVFLLFIFSLTKKRASVVHFKLVFLEAVVVLAKLSPGNPRDRRHRAANSTSVT